MANPAKNQKTAQPAKLSVEELKSAAGADQDVKALNIFEKLSRVRVWFAENGIRSSGYNEFSKWSYVQLSDFLNPMPPSCLTPSICCRWLRSPTLLPAC